MTENFTPDLNSGEIHNENPPQISTVPMDEGHNTFAALSQKQPPLLKEDFDELTAINHEEDSQISKKEEKKFLQKKTEKMKAAEKKLVRKNQELSAAKGLTINAKQLLESIKKEIETEKGNKKLLLEENAEVVKLNSDLDNSIAEKTKEEETIEATISELENELPDLENQKLELEKFINENTPLKEDLLKSKSQIEEELRIAKEAVASNQTMLDRLREEIAEKTSESNRLEANYKLLRNRDDLYSRDLAGISADNKGQRTKYLIAIGISFLSILLSIRFLVLSVQKEPFISDTLLKYFQATPSYPFFILLLMRVSLIGIIIFLIVLFYNLTRAFVSQHIRTQEKMTAVRIIEFLISKIGKEEVELSADQKLEYQKEKLKRQNDLLSEMLPNLIEHNPSSFDKLSKTDLPHEKMIDILKIIKQEKAKE